MDIHSYLKEAINNKNFIIYLAIGVINTIIGFGVIFLLMYLDFKPELANFMGYSIGISVSFFLNKKFNFKSRGSLLKEIKRFAIAMGTAYLVNLLVLITLGLFYVNKYLAQIIAGGFYVVVGYLLSKFWVFGGQK